MGDPRLRRALLALGVTEIVSWGVLYYAFPVLVSDAALGVDPRPASPMAGSSRSTGSGATDGR